MLGIRGSSGTECDAVCGNGKKTALEDLFAAKNEDMMMISSL